ncbi:DUF7513 family protein [Haloarchaeobius amylolyticus]|uniref:DUF7513 family protein n=1 Tax=Haloarchaeobius amylolyticus TaxID=1198296 RepID=UPI00227085D0|nr:hypothetical protein [Haloarchaeobius amylolyticus]
MSLLSSLLAGVGFRTRTPSFGQGEEVTGFVSDARNGEALLRIGDSELYVQGVDDPERLVDERVVVRVEEFDDSTSAGKAVLVEVIEGRGL